MGAETSSMPFDPICVLVCALLDALGCAPACRCRVRDIWAGDMSDVDTDVVCAGSNPVYVDFMAVHTLPYGAVRSGAVLSVSAPMDAFDGVARALSVWRFCAGNNAGAGGTGIPEILGTSAIERAWSGDPSRRRARMHGQCEGAAGAQFLFRPDCGGNIQFGSHRATHEFRVGCSAGRMGRGELFVYCFHIFVLIALIGAETLFPEAWPVWVWWGLTPGIYALCRGMYLLLRQFCPIALVVMTGGR